MKTAASNESGVRECFSQTKIQLAQIPGSDGILLSHAEYFLTQSRRKCYGNMAEEFRTKIRRRAGDAREGSIDAVSGGAGHQTEDQHGPGAHKICFLSSARRFSASSGLS